MLKITKRKMDVYDFMKNKGHKPFSAWRTVAKTENFGLLFGCSAGRFAIMLENAGFTEAQCDEYISLTKNQDMYESLLNQGKMSSKQCKFLTVATVMRDAFFAGYKGLEDRIKREQDFALQHGYVRTWHGPVRHLSELRFMKTSEDGGLIGADKKLYSKEFAHLLNQACNSTVQSMESRIAFSTWHNINQYCKEWGLKSYLWNNIHDSLDAYIYKPEAELVVSLMNACAAWEREPVEGIHMSFDGELSDMQDMAHRENTYWKHGVEVKALPIEEAVANYNKKFNKNIVWHGCE